MKTFILFFALFALGDCQFGKPFHNEQFQKTYLYSTNSMDYNGNVELCKKNGAILVQPRSQEEVQYIFSTITKVPFRIGAQVTNQVTPSKFLDGTTITNIQWANGYGTGSYLDNCTTLNVRSDLRWFTGSCNYNYRTVCERPFPNFASIRAIVGRLFDKQRRQDQEIANLKQNITEQMAANKLVEEEMVKVHRNEFNELYTNLTKLA